MQQEVARYTSSQMSTFMSQLSAYTGTLRTLETTYGNGLNGSVITRTNTSSWGAWWPSKKLANFYLKGLFYAHNDDDWCSIRFRHTTDLVSSNYVEVKFHLGEDIGRNVYLYANGTLIDSAATTTWHYGDYFRLWVLDDCIKVKMWRYDVAEPANWQLSAKTSYNQTKASSLQIHFGSAVSYAGIGATPNFPLVLTSFGLSKGEIKTRSSSGVIRLATTSLPGPLKVGTNRYADLMDPDFTYPTEYSSPVKVATPDGVRKWRKFVEE